MRALGTIALASTVLLLGACTSDDDLNDDVPEPVSSGNAFVIEQFDQTADNTEPISINDLDLVFSTDPAAFDDILNCE